MNNNTRGEYSLRTALTVLTFFSDYSIRRYPYKVATFLILKTFEFLTQLLSAFFLVKLLQSKMPGNYALGGPDGGLVNSLLALDISVGVLILYFAFLVFLNAFMMYWGRRILTRILIETENNLSFKVIAKSINIDFAAYKKLQYVFPNFNERSILKIVQRNTRLAGIVCRNLVEAIFSAIQLVLVCIVFLCLGYNLAPLLLLFLVVATGLSLLWLFKLGMNHSIDFPASAIPAAGIRSKIISQIIAKKSLQPLEGYNDETKILKHLKHFEDRFKIIDQGNLLFGLIISAALTLLLISIFVLNFQLNTTSFVVLLFIGNSMFRSLQQLSSFFVVIGRLYNPIFEIWKYDQAISDVPPGNIALSSETLRLIDRYGVEIDLGETKVAAICQYDDADYLAIFKALARFGVSSEELAKYASNKIVFAKTVGESANVHLDGYKTIENRFSGVSEVISQKGLSIYAACQNDDAIVVVPIEMIKDLVPELLEALIAEQKSKLLLFYGRSPLLGLKGHQKNIPTTLLSGERPEILSSIEVLELGADQIRAILSVSDSSDFGAYDEEL